MGLDSDSSGFEYYKNKKTETVFETFLRYTDQKEKSSVFLAALLDESIGPNFHLLDIGTGTGEFLKLALSKVKALPRINLTLIEPSDDLVKQLPGSLDELAPSPTIHLSHSTFDDFSTKEKFDVVIASHLFYHIPKNTWRNQITKMVSLLKPGGRVIIVQREEDEAYAFKMRFKPLIFGEKFKSITLSDVMATFPSSDSLRIVRHGVTSHIRFPIDTN
jgi:cyclopropane fatty-acyl-phospholipid synthase-like methyltransferase